MCIRDSLYIHNLYKNNRKQIFHICLTSKDTYLGIWQCNKYVTNLLWALEGTEALTDHPQTLYLTNNILKKTKQAK